MENKKCLQTRGVLRRKVLGYGRRGVLGRKVVGYGRLGAALIIVMATLTWASGAVARTCKAIHVFKGTDGAYPYAGLIFDAAGNLYGTTSGGGAHKRGAVFKLAPNPDGTWTESVLYSFRGGVDGWAPYAGLVFDAAGNLYGTGQNGGANGSGVVFKLAPNPDGTWTESVLHSFAYTDGSFPAGLIFDAAGNLYGTTLQGGAAAGYGVVFKLKPNPDGTWTESVLHAFTGGADGSLLYAGLTLRAGALYGTTYEGGDCSGFGCGVVFKLTPSSSGWSETVLHTFLGFGENPAAPVIFDPAGNLYGTTTSGSTNKGLVFKLTP